MRRMVMVALAASFVPTAVSQAFIEGTWKIDLKQTKTVGKPSLYVLKDGKFSCESPCIVGVYTHPDKGTDNPWSVPADGADHPVSGVPGVTTITIQIVNETQIHETNKLDGKIVWSADIKILPDGKTRLISWQDPAEDGKAAKDQKFMETLLSPGPPGAHAVSGLWSMIKTPMQMEGDPKEEDLITVYKVEGDQLIESDTKKVIYRAKVDGPEVQIEGEPPDSTVAVKLIDANTLEEIYKKGGVVTFTSRMTIRSDGKTMDVTNTWNNPIGLVDKSVALKQ